MDVFLGFDPDGRGNFGWSICQPEGAGDNLAVIKTGTADHAKSVICAVKECLERRGISKDCVRAAGIDAPLFWTNTGFRDIDVAIRCAVRRAGCATPEGTVQAINSLRSSCTVQGVLLGYLLSCEFTLSITEAHPTALDWLDNTMRCHIVNLPGNGHEHKRDATFAAYAAWRMYQRAAGWHDLFCREPHPVLPLQNEVSYWMPIPPQPPMAP